MLMAAQLIVWGWVLLLLIALAVLWRRTDVQIEIWSGARPWTPHGAAARAIQWRRQKTGRRELDRIVGFPAGEAGRDHAPAGSRQS